jgi:hypothetical protein
VVVAVPGGDVLAFLARRLEIVLYLVEKHVEVCRGPDALGPEAPL